MKDKSILKRVPNHSPKGPPVSVKQMFREALNSLPVQLYRHYDKNGSLLYVGISVSALGRLKQHTRSAAWIEKVSVIAVETFNNRQDALQAEAIAIRTESPIYNTRLPSVACLGGASTKKVVFDSAAFGAGLRILLKASFKRNASAHAAPSTGARP